MKWVYGMGYSPQNSLLLMFVKWMENFSKEGNCGTLFENLSAPFITLPTG